MKVLTKYPVYYSSACGCYSADGKRMSQNETFKQLGSKIKSTIENKPKELPEVEIKGVKDNTISNKWNSLPTPTKAGIIGGGVIFAGLITWLIVRKK